MAASPWILEAKLETFESQILQKSFEKPIVVDVWAAWCQPCLMLAPILEKIVNEAAGAVLLVKINSDEEPQLAAMFGVQSLPSVFLLRDGQLVDAFQGALPESQVRAWLEPYLPNPYQQAVDKARELEASDPAAAEKQYRAAVELKPDESAARIGLARVLLKQGQDAPAAAIIQELKARGYLETEAENVAAELELRAASRDAGGVAKCRAACAADPDNLELRLALADALAAAHQFQEALDICLELIRQDRARIGEPAREAMVKIFQVLGPGSDLASQYRRKLATALY